MSGFKCKKSVQLLSYFAMKEGGVLNKMKALKLVWLSDRLHLRKYARLITGDSYFAMPNGPVASSCRDILEMNPAYLSSEEFSYAHQFLQSAGYTFTCVNQPDYKALSETDLECADAIYEEYGRLSEFELSDRSHNFPEWIKYSLGIKSGQYSRHEIQTDDLYLQTDGERIFSEDEEYLVLSQKIFSGQFA